MIYNILFYDIENFILRYLNKNWNIKYLIKNKIINFNNLTKLKNVNKNIIDEYSHESWDWKWLIENTNINVEYYISLNLIEKYKYNWNYFKLSKNPNLIEEFILKYSYQGWNIEYLIYNNKIINFKALTKFKNIDEDIIDNYPNKPWDWEWLIENTEIIIEQYIPLNLIEKYNYKLCYWNLSKNLNITEEFILKYPDKSWDIKYLIENNKITDFKSLSKFKNINQSIINKYLNKPWNWEWLIENTNINVKRYFPLELFKKYKNKWNYNDLSKILNLNEEFILKYPYQNWDIEYLIDNNKITDFNILSKFKNINKKIIDKYPNKPWDWGWLIKNTDINVKRYIPFNLIEKYQNKWGYWDLSKNLNLTEEFILKYPNKPWDIDYLINNNKITDFKALTKFKYIDEDIIDKYPDKSWDWKWLIENTDINVEFYIPFNLIEKYPYKWNYRYLNYNPNLTEEFILKYPNKCWNIKYLIKKNKITDFKTLTKFKHINQDIIDEYPNKPWEWGWLIKNTNINIDIKYIPFNIIKKYLYKLF